MVWYPRRCALAVGSKSFVDGVDRLVTGAGSALGQDATFLRARPSFDRSALATGYIDPSAAGDDAAEAEPERGDPLVGESAPIVVSLRATPRVIVDFRTTLSGDALPDPEVYAPSGPLTLAERLPDTAIAWLAYSSTFGLAGPELAAQLEPLMTGDLLVSLQEHTGLDVPSLLTPIGDQGIVAVLAPPVPAPRSSIRALLAGGALVFIQEIATDSESQRIVKAATAHAASQWAPGGVEVTEHGFVAPLPAKQRSRQGKVLIVDARGPHLWISLGDPDLSKRGMRAFRTGTHSLGAVGRRGIGKQLPAKRMALWVDSRWAEAPMEKLGAHGREIASGDRLSWLDLSVHDQGYALAAELDLATVEIAVTLGIDYAMDGMFESLGRAVARDLGNLFSRPPSTRP